LADLDSEDGSFHPDLTVVFHNGFDRGEICRWLEEAGFGNVSAHDACSMKRATANGKVRDYPLFLATGRVS
jgi:hypothetical protein